MHVIFHYNKHTNQEKIISILDWFSIFNLFEINTIKYAQHDKLKMFADFVGNLLRPFAEKRQHITGNNSNNNFLCGKTKL